MNKNDAMTWVQEEITERGTTNILRPLEMALHVLLQVRVHVLLQRAEKIIISLTRGEVSWHLYIFNVVLLGDRY